MSNINNPDYIPDNYPDNYPDNNSSNQSPITFSASIDYIKYNNVSIYFLKPIKLIIYYYNNLFTITSPELFISTSSPSLFNAKLQFSSILGCQLLEMPEKTGKFRGIPIKSIDFSSLHNTDKN